MDLSNVPILDEQLKTIENQISDLQDEARNAITNAVVTDENIEQAYGAGTQRDRYILIRPDGAPAIGFPYRYGSLYYVQRPAALKALKWAIPGTRLLDRRERKIITQDEIN